MGKRLMAVLLAAALCLGLAGCGNGEEASSRPEEAAFSAEIWETKRPKIALSLTEPDIVDTTFTHDDTGLAIARLLGQELIVYPRYARDLRKGYIDLPEEYLLLTVEGGGYEDENGVLHPGVTLEDGVEVPFWCGDPDDNDKTKTYDFVIDYVRVYQKAA